MSFQLFDSIQTITNNDRKDYWWYNSFYPLIISSHYQPLVHSNPSHRYYRMINTSYSLQHLFVYHSLICSHIDAYLCRCEVYVMKRNYTSFTTLSLMNNHSGNWLYRSDSMISEGILTTLYQLNTSPQHSCQFFSLISII